MMRESMMITDYEPKRVMYYFEQITRIPRESGNEQHIRDYLLDYAKEHSIEALVDKTGNLIMRKPATKGFEHIPSVALQGHMDMVCVADDGIEHDFSKDPLKLVIEGDMLTAEGTTLGADNGIAIAMILALFEDEQTIHGPLEAILTISEETGLDGAFGLDADLVRSRRLVNLDSEEEGIFYIGCAGGGEVIGELKVELEPVREDEVCLSLNVSGLLGGHSGAEIHTGRGNAIQALVRILKAISRKSSIRFTSLHGGSKRNVIPSSCTSSFILSRTEETAAVEIAQRIEQELRNEYGKNDPGLKVTISREELPEEAVNSAASQAVIDALYLTPTGVDSMSTTIEGLVETSNNLAVVRFSDDTFSFTASQRSSIASSRDDIEERTCTAFETCGARTRRENKYPSWTPDPSSPMARFCASFYAEFTGKEPIVTAIHAGLECGLINSKIEGMDSISFGPDLEGVHSTAERMSISSAARTYEYLKALLEHMTVSVF